jgi:hypothetical protein
MVDSASLGAEESAGGVGAAAAASGGVRHRPEVEEAQVAGWAAWAGPRWLGYLGRPAGQGWGSGGDKATQEEGRGDGPEQGGDQEVGEDGAGWPGGERGQAPAGLGRGGLGRLGRIGE